MDGRLRTRWVEGRAKDLQRPASFASLHPEAIEYSSTHLSSAEVLYGDSMDGLDGPSHCTKGGTFTYFDFGLREGSAYFATPGKSFRAFFEIFLTF
jgi:hypothetical protein